MSSAALRTAGLAVLFAVSLAQAQTDTAWVRTYDGTAHDYDYIAASTVDRWGNIIVVGYATDTASGLDFVTIRYWPNGDTCWVRTYNGPGNEWDIARAVAVDRIGNVYVAGESKGVGTGRDYALVQYSPTGDQRWVARFSGPGDTADCAYAIALDSSGNCYVTGSSFLGTGSDFLTVKFNPDGDTVWSRRYDSSDDWGHVIAVDSAGNVYVSGSSYGSPFQFTTLKYSPAGDLLWSRSCEEEVTDMALGPGGRLYVGGLTYRPHGDMNFLTIAYDAATGDSQWIAVYNGPANDEDEPYALAVGASGRIYVTGTSARDTITWAADFLTICYTPDGETAWVRRVEGTGHDFAEAIAVDDAENVYVGGHGRDSLDNNSNIAVCFDAAGNRQWLSYLRGPGNGGEWTTARTFGSGGVYFGGYWYGAGTMSDCVLARFGAVTGISEPARHAQPGARAAPTVVRGTLRVAARSSIKPQASSCLLDASGRKVMKLNPGANDVSQLVPGVYFVHEQLKPKHQAQAVRKIILTR